jgi:hypothetical protein
MFCPIDSSYVYQNSFQLPHINRFSLDFYALKNNTIACASAEAMATRGRLCNDFSPLQTFDKLNLFIRHLKTKLVLFSMLIQPLSSVFSKSDKYAIEKDD